MMPCKKNHTLGDRMIADCDLCAIEEAHAAGRRETLQEVWEKWRWFMEHPSTPDDVEAPWENWLRTQLDKDGEPHDG